MNKKPNKNRQRKKQCANTSSSLDCYLKLKCLEILDELLNHPISRVFSEPVDPVADEAPDYFDIIKTPMDFSTVRKKLDERQYKSFHEFQQDVHLIFSNAIKYNGKYSLIASMAIELQTIFKFFSKIISDNPHSTWYNELLQLKTQLADHVHSASEFCPEAFPSLPQKQIGETPHIDSGCKVAKFESRVMNEKELRILANNILKIKEKRQKAVIVNIIRRYNPEVELSNGCLIDLDLLTPLALREIQEFITVELAKMGYSYQ